VVHSDKDLSENFDAHMCSLHKTNSNPAPRMTPIDTFELSFEDGEEDADLKQANEVYEVQISPKFPPRFLKPRPKNSNSKARPSSRIIDNFDLPFDDAEDDDEHALQHLNDANALQSQGSEDNSGGQEVLHLLFKQ